MRREGILQAKRRSCALRFLHGSFVIGSRLHRTSPPSKSEREGVDGAGQLPLRRQNGEHFALFLISHNTNGQSHAMRAAWHAALCESDGVQSDPVIADASSTAPYAFRATAKSLGDSAVKAWDTRTMRSRSPFIVPPKSLAVVSHPTMVADRAAQANLRNVIAKPIAMLPVQAMRRRRLRG